MGGAGGGRILVAVPARDCERSVAKVVRDCLRHVPDVLVIDDGSRDDTSERASRAGARVLRHDRNLGKGAAIAAAANEAFHGRFTALLTIDADGQHSGEDIPRFLEAHRARPSTLWVGWRREAMERTPAARRFGNQFSNRALAALGGVRLPDTQCGLRLYPSEFLRCVTVRGSRYEAETELLVKAAELRWDVQPVPVRVSFEDGRPTSHYRPWIDTTRICASVLRCYLRRRLAHRGWIAAGLAVTHAPLLWAAAGATALATSAAPALAFHTAMTVSLLRPRGQAWADTEVEFRPTPGRAEVALTFDDGPDPTTTPQILDILERSRAQATFFMVGERVERFPELAVAATERGHALGNHTHRHPASFSLLGRARLADEVDRAQEALERACARPPVMLRPPAGHKNVFLAEVLRSRRLRCVTWSARAFDTLGRSPAYVAESLARQARPGSILLLHEGRKSRSSILEALPRLIERLATRGFDFVSLPGAA